MRGDEEQQEGFIVFESLEDQVPADHPLRSIRRLTDRALERIDEELDKLYASTGRESIPPERLLRALLLMVLYSVRSERQLMEQLNYNLLFRWFVGLGADEDVWDESSFSNSRAQLFKTDIRGRFFSKIGGEAAPQGLFADEHFIVDVMLIESLASQKNGE